MMKKVWFSAHVVALVAVLFGTYEPVLANKDALDKAMNDGIPNSNIRGAPGMFSSLGYQMDMSERSLAEDYSCDVSSDTCPFKGDDVCDSTLGETVAAGCEKENSDCLDCNSLTCGTLDFDCTGCINAIGCFWCPTNARCYNSDLHELRQSDTCGTGSGQTPYLNGQAGDTCTIVSKPFSDPLYPANEWLYDMIKVTAVWEQGVYGKGVRVRINDDGVQDLSEFQGRYDKSASCESHIPVDNPDDPNSHGTTVASIVAAAGNNDLCAVGIAPEATISSCDLLGKGTGGGTGTFDFQLDSFDISQNSWNVNACVQRDYADRLLQEGCPFKHSDPEYFSPCEKCDFTNAAKTLECEETIFDHCSRFYELDEEACLTHLDSLVSGCDYTPDGTTSELEAMAKGVKDGRGGRGIIYVFAAGNEYNIGEEVNMEALLFSRFTIAVAAVGKDRKHSSYSSAGASVLVSAPGGDDEFSSSLLVASLADGQCADSGTGTSFAAPVVSGVLALMLEVNPHLSWRDVQGIIAETSDMVVDDPLDTSRVVNGAGLIHSNLYGFGIINAEKAVNTARGWELYGPEKFLSGESGTVDKLLPDSTDPVSTSITISRSASNDQDFVTETTAIALDLDHDSRGDLEIVLTSPSGTESVMHPGRRIENTILLDDDRWNLTTVRNYGESPYGEWTLAFRDLRSGSLTTQAVGDMLTSWQLIIYGREVDSGSGGDTGGDGDRDGDGNRGGGGDVITGGDGGGNTGNEGDGDNTKKAKKGGNNNNNKNVKKGGNNDQQAASALVEAEGNKAVKKGGNSVNIVSSVNSANNEDEDAKKAAKKRRQ